MERARNQAENYARRLPREEIAGGRPPFLLVADVGHSIALYADWSRAGGHYAPFPDPASYRIALDDLRRDDILERLVRLNAVRAAEEAAGHIRWLRPEYQAPAAGSPGVQGKLIEEEEETVAVAGAVAEKRAWPDTLAAQAAALRDLLARLEAPADVPALAAAFEGKRTAKRLADIQRLLETLAALGQVEEVKPGVWER